MSNIHTRAKVVAFSLITAAVLVGRFAAWGSNQPNKQPDIKQQAAQAPRATYILPDGSIRIVTYSGMAGVVNALNAVFLKSHPEAKFAVKEGDNYSAMASLTFGTTFLAPMGTRFTTIGLGNNLKIAPAPIGFRIAHASLTSGTPFSPLAIIVNRSNPLRILRMEQVERIFTSNAPTSDITQWSQLGIVGKLGDRLIVPYGPPGSDYYRFEDPQVGEYIARKMGNRNFNHNYRQMQTYKDVVAVVSQEISAIGIAPINQLTPEVRAVGLAVSSSSTVRAGSRKDIRSGQYPFDRYLYLYLRVNKNSGLDPLAKEYVRMVLAPEGQQTISSEIHGYIPLSSGEIAEEISKLD